jgi:hypothetical protein
MIRIRLHLKYNEQNDNIPPEGLNKNEEDTLNKTKHLVLIPLYLKLKAFFEQDGGHETLGKAFFHFDLLEFGFNDFLARPDQGFKSFITHLVSFLANRSDPTHAYKRHKHFFEALPEEDIYNLRNHYRTCLTRAGLSSIAEDLTKGWNRQRMANLREMNDSEKATRRATYPIPRFIRGSNQASNEDLNG